MKRLLYFALIASLVVSFTSCKDQDDIYKQWVVPGGSVYPEKANGLNAKLGNHRLILSWPLPKDPAVTKAVVTWDNGERSKELNYADFAGKDSVYMEIDQLKEQSYTFNIENYDKNGNKSMKVEGTFSPYGNIWLSTHSERNVKLAEVSSGTNASLSLDFGTNEMVATKFRYMNNDGEWVVTDPVPSNVASTILENAKVNRYYQISSGYCPAEGLDTVWNEWAKSAIPIAYRLDTTGWEVTATGHNASNPPSKVFDGVITAGNQNGAWCWNNGDKWPVVLQIDMKKADTYVVTRLRVVNFLNSMAARRLFNVAYFFGDEPFNLDPGSTYQPVNVNPWPIFSEPSFKNAKFSRATTFWNGDAFHWENANNSNCRYIAMTMHNSRLKTQIACQEIEVYGCDLSTAE